MSTEARPGASVALGCHWLSEFVRAKTVANAVGKE
jgi:hypothetical protein